MTKSNWAVDQAHSIIEFSIKHLMIAKVRGVFHQFEANIEADLTNLEQADVSFSIDLASVDTRNQERDDHLRSADFFEVEQYPKLTFKSTSIVKKTENEFLITGDVTLHGVTNQETFDLTFEGSSIDPWGDEKSGFSASGSIKRSDYGLTYNSTLETGGMLISDEVKINIEIEAQKL